MDLLNQTLNSFSIQSFDIKTVFDANLVNLTLLDGGLFYLLSNALSENLLERQKKSSANNYRIRRKVGRGHSPIN
jgi:hypothetical protein